MNSIKRHGRRFAIVVSVVSATLVIGVVTAVAVSIRVDSGAWRMPDRADFVRIARRFDSGPSRTIYLERNAVELGGGEDHASRGISSVLQNAGASTVRSKGWTGGEKMWKQYVACVQKMFEPFDVVVTDQRPAHDEFMMVVVGGKPGDLGIKGSHHVSGLAPFHGGVIPRAVVYAFSAAMRNDVRGTCETTAMEVAHAYGLDHEYLCKDVMTYLQGCGAKKFIDQDAPCGGGKKRACEGGASTQNSYRRLLQILGPRPGTGPPVPVGSAR